MNGKQHLNCREALERLWGFIDGELEAAEADAVHAHLAACRSCYPHYDYQRAFCEFLHSQERETAPPELRRRIFLSLLREK